MNYELEQGLKQFVQQEVLSNLVLTDYRDQDYTHVIELRYGNITIGNIRVSG